MTGAELLQDLIRRGHRLRLDGSRLLCKPAPSECLLEALRGHKPEVIELLRADQQELFDHKAGVYEFEGGLPREEAERLATPEVYGADSPEMAKHKRPQRPIRTSTHASADLCEDPAGIKPRRQTWGDHFAMFHPPVGTTPSATPGVPTGWTPVGWARHLRYMADACECLHPDKSAEHRRRAADIEPRSGGQT